MYRYAERISEWRTIKKASKKTKIKQQQQTANRSSTCVKTTINLGI